MSIFRNRPKGNYLMEANLQEIYVLTNHWKNDLEFYRTDLDFLKKLIDKYFIWIGEEDNLKEVRRIGKTVQDMKNECKDLLTKVKEHLLQLGKLLEKPESPDSRIFRMEHEHLEDEIAEFVKKFRVNKKEVYTITEHVIDAESLSDMLKT